MHCFSLKNEDAFLRKIKLLDYMTIFIASTSYVIGKYNMKLENGM